MKANQRWICQPFRSHPFQFQVFGLTPVIRQVCLRDSPKGRIIIDFNKDQEQLVGQISNVGMHQHFKHGQRRIFAGI